MADQLELNLRRFSYDGEKRGFAFQKFVNWHKIKHIISNGLVEYGYSGVDYNFNVRMLIIIINTNSLKACKAAILYSPYMQGGFDILGRHLHDFVAMNLISSE